MKGKLFGGEIETGGRKGCLVGKGGAWESKGEGAYRMGRETVRERGEDKTRELIRGTIEGDWGEEKGVQGNV